MAPVLRKSQSHAKLGGPSEEKKKRKAPEDVSPASAKKQKALKEARPKKGKKQRGKTAPAERTVPEGEREVEIEPVAPETALVLHNKADSDHAEEADPDIQAFVSAFDEDSDGSDEPADDEAEPIRDVGKIPKPRPGRQMERQADDQADGGGGGDGDGGGSGVIYVGRIPHGFYEHQMREYFGQFGAISRLRMSRNRKTGASKHYGFVEFADEETADIVARTMNNYLLFGRLLKCHVMPRSSIHERMWIGAERRFKRIPWGRVDARRLEQARPESGWDRRAERQRAKRAGRAEKLRALGYEYEAPELKKAVAQIEPVSPAVIEGAAPSPAPAPTLEAAVV